MGFSIFLRAAMVLVGAVVGVSSYREGAGQYHIQTDEGPDRYFRYQTHNGQFRKEKRLDDGTVFGTYGWIDPTGLLRLYDYAAGKEGYRLIRERERQVPVPKVPKLGAEVSPKTQLLRKRKPVRVRTRVRPLGAAPQNSLDFQRVPVSTSFPKRGPSSLSNNFQHTLKAESVDTLFGTVSSSEEGKNSEVSAPEGATRATSPGRPRTRQRVSVTAKHTSDQVGSNANKLKSIDSSGAATTQQASASAAAAASSSSSPTRASAIDPVKFPRLPPLPPGARYTIRYDLGQQFHEEQTLADGSRIGRHGYVDPFGILRVTYYNTDAEGQLHQRKESRWVGSRQAGQS
ncbi:uncharacterized protein LOC143036392 [Oratosquilla oratoria]|uniref:uncharacterized protein LOC143036392 n=1 Tax=Oratosquilla oratoria TaxID=337810 RepID=UPI003F76FA6C